MKVMQSSLVLLFALVVQFLSTAVATTPVPADYEPGTIVLAKPEHWGDTDRVGVKGNRKPGKHYGIVVGKNQNGQNYKVAHISHNLPQDKYPHQDDATKYHKNFSKGSKINTGKPVEVAQEHLHPTDPNVWAKVEGQPLAALKAEINKNCPGANLRKRGLGCPWPKPNQNAAPKGKSPQLNEKKALPKPGQNAPKGKSPQLQGKKAWPKPIQSAPKGKSPQLNGKKA